MYQLVFICIFTVLVVAELFLASLVDHSQFIEELERDEVSFMRAVVHSSTAMVTL